MTPAIQDGVQIRRITTASGRALRDVRLRALETDPGAYGSTWAAVAARPESFWHEWVGGHAAGSNAYTLLAWRAGEPVGLVRLQRDADRPDVFGLFSMWVAPEVRRRGVGLRLLAAAEEWVVAAGGAEIELDVVDREPAARALYTRAGFVLDGRSQPSVHPGATELGMRKRLVSS